MTHFIWHIDRAKFDFEDRRDYESWQDERKIFFQIDPSLSDAPVLQLFRPPDWGYEEFELTSENSKTAIGLGESGPIISAWILWQPELQANVALQDVLDWAAELAGWQSGSLSLGDFEATLTEDDGGDVRIFEATAKGD